MLSESATRVHTREAAWRTATPLRQSGLAAAVLRQQGRVLSPRVVWVNEAAVLAKKPGTKD